MIVVIIVLAYAVVVLTDLQAVLKSHKLAVIVPYLFILCLAAVLQTLNELHAKVPSPAEYITHMITGAFHLK